MIYQVVILLFSALSISACRSNTSQPESKNSSTTNSCVLDPRLTHFIEDESSNIEDLPKTCIVVYGASGLEICMNKIANCESIVNVEAFAMLLYDLNEQHLLDSTLLNESSKSYILAEASILKNE